MNKMLLFFLLCVSAVTAQERIHVEGVVRGQGEELENVHISNVSSRQVSVSGSNGQFLLSMREGDTLLFTHITMLDLVKVVSGEEMASGLVSAEMAPRDHELEEVLLEDYSHINVVDLGIISEKKPVPTPYERRLHTAGDFKWYHLLSILGGSLQVDPILNAINGRTKKLKRNIGIEKEIKNIRLLTEGHMDYMKEHFEATEAEIHEFLNYLVEQESLQTTIDRGNEDGLRFYLLEEWFKYRE